MRVLGKSLGRIRLLIRQAGAFEMPAVIADPGFRSEPLFCPACESWCRFVYPSPVRKVTTGLSFCLLRDRQTSGDRSDRRAGVSNPQLVTFGSSDLSGHSHGDLKAARAVETIGCGPALREASRDMPLGGEPRGGTKWGGPMHHACAKGTSRWGHASGPAALQRVWRRRVSSIMPATRPQIA